MPNRNITEYELKHSRDVGGATYLSAYAHLMARAMGVDDSNFKEMNHMALQMLGPLNYATQAAWCALMKDDEGMKKASEKFHHALDALRTDKKADA